MTGSSTEAHAPSALAAEARTRRTFAIISHPDAGKTTLTEKLLLFSGAIDEAGAVKARRQARSTTSDWMELERTRGISISSTVLRFAHDRWVFNLLDTPGHADFSEDTYRTLWAADAAIVVIDRAKGIEAQTRKLFRVCRARGVPIITFINKCDRPGRAPLELLDDIESEFEVEPVPVTWPVGDGIVYAGIVDRRGEVVIDVERTPHGASAGEEHVRPVSAGPPPGCPAPEWREALDELDLVAHASPPLDRAAVLTGRQTPVYFGSALTNLGLRLLLEGFAAIAPSPRPAMTTSGSVRALDAPFAGFVFKIQANTDPRHRDRIAFLRIASGRFERGMMATNARTNRPITLRFAHELFGRDRVTIDDAVPGDIVGIVNATGVLVGDTLYADEPAEFPPIPTFAPERFVRLRNLDASRYKRFRAGLVQLDEEGVVHVLRQPGLGDQEPILGAVGDLQFEVARHRLENEFGCPVRITPTAWIAARLVDGESTEVSGYGVSLVEDSRGRTVALFESPVSLARVVDRAPAGVLVPVGIDAGDPLASIAGIAGIPG
jgi:peptide chain release factor 3